MKQITNPTEALHIPISGYVDITGMEHIFAHPYVQLLRWRRELGFAMMIKIGGLYSRLEHCIGTMHRARQMLHRFEIRPDDPLYRAVETYAALHDVGHGGTCHELEYVLNQDHNENGLRLLGRMQEAVSTYADYDTVRALMDGSHPWHVLVKDKNIGADKLDYLERDAYHMDYDIALNTGKIISCLQYRDGKFGVDEEALDDVLTNQFNYLRMYLSVYLHPVAKVFARMYVRALTEELAKHKLPSEEIWGLVDFELEALIAKHPLMRRLLVRGVMRPVCNFKIKGYEKFGVPDLEDNVSAIGIPLDEISLWSDALNHAELILSMERELERQIGIPEHSLLISQTDPLRSSLVPKDVLIFRRNSNRFVSLFGMIPSHKEELIERTRRAFILRVVVEPQYAEQASRFDFLSFFRERLAVQRTFFEKPTT